MNNFSKLNHDLSSFLDQLYSGLMIPSPRGRRTPPGALIVGDCPETAEDIFYESSDLDLHGAIIGGSGVGKSRLVIRVGHQLVWRKKRYGEGFSCIDTHGATARALRDLIATDAPELAQETVFMDLKQAGKVVAYNPVMRDADPQYLAECLTEGVLKACGEVAINDKPLLARTMIKLVQALKLTGGSLTDSNFLLYRTAQDREVLSALIQQLPEATSLRSFWQDLKTKSPAQAELYTVGVLNRLERFVEPVALRRMLGQTTSSLSFSSLTDTGGIFLADLSRAGTSVSREGQRVVAALLAQEFYQEIDRRDGDGNAVPHTIVLEEAGEYATPELARALTSGRKFAMRFLLCCQGLSQLVWDTDRTLLETVLALPNKVCFGRVSPGEAKVLAESIFFGLLNPFQVKYWPKTVTWDPVDKLVTLRGRSRGGSNTESNSDSSTRGGGMHSSQGASEVSTGGRSSGQATTRDEAGRESTSEHVGDSESWSRSAVSSRGESSNWSTSSQHTFSSTENWSESEQEAWVTFHRKRVQKGSPLLYSLDEQIISYAKLLSLQPQRRCIVSRIGQIPRQCKVSYVSETDLTEAERQRFLDEMYRQVPRIFMDPDEADRLIEARKEQLLGSAEEADDLVE